MSPKKFSKSKFITDELSGFSNEYKNLKTSSINKKPLKRQRPEEIDEDDNTMKGSKLLAKTNAKKTNMCIEVCDDSRQKLLNVMRSQLEIRKQNDNQLLDKLSQVCAQMEADYNAVKSNEQKFQHLAGAFVNCIEQATTTQVHMITAIEDIHSSYKEQSEEIVTEHKAEIDKMVDILEEGIKNLEDKFVSEIKPRAMETVRETIHAIQNYF